MARHPLPSTILVTLALAGCGSTGGLTAADAGADTAAPADGSSGESGDGSTGGSPDGATCSTAGADEPGLVAVQSGLVRGQADGATWVFRGIPYAAPPVGDLRWRLPRPYGCFTGVFEATSSGAVCAQFEKGADGTYALTGSEDCLTLNVWVPAAAASSPRPVMVWIHGGGHQQGSGSDPNYDGRRLAENEDVIVVTVNYRLGPFGFLALPALTAEGGPQGSGNYGMHDQIAALRWVHDNISGFGGDPAHVTAFGESAGAVSVCRLVASPLAAGLFQSAAIESGACVATPLATAEAHGTAVADDVGCGSAADILACLRSKSTADIMATLDPVIHLAEIGRNAYDGVIDGYALPLAPRDLIAARQHNAVPVIIGSNADELGKSVGTIPTLADYEAAVRALLVGVPDAVIAAALDAYPVSDYGSYRAAFIALASDVKFTCNARRDARLLAAAQDAAVYRYFFAKIPDNASATVRAWGAFHGIEILYVFGTLETLGNVSGPGDATVIAAVQGYWSRLAAQGDPNGSGALTWPRTPGTGDPVLDFDASLSVAQGPRSAQCDFWDALTGH